MSAKRALITGATGFVGANLARLALERGRTVRVLVRKGSDRRNIPESASVEVFEGDLRDAGSVRKATKGCDEVFHVAADYRFWAKDARELYDSNVEGTKNLLEAARLEGVGKFVHTSTVGTIGLSQAPLPCNETTAEDPGQWGSHYKLSKLQAEKLALDAAKNGMPVVIVNPSTPIGAWDRKPTPTGKIIVDFVRGKIPAYVHTGLNFVHVRDVCEGQLLAAEKGKIGERYILGNQNLTMIEFLKLIGKLTGRKAPRFRIPYPIAYAVGAVSTAYADHISRKEPGVALEAVKMSKRYMFFDSSKAVRELGLPQTPIQDAAQEGLHWFSQNGYLKGTNS
jgi:dihydroflavonol-4-reductase